jgi:hypothetical protein
MYGTNCATELHIRFVNLIYFPLREINCQSVAYFVLQVIKAATYLKVFEIIKKSAASDINKSASNLLCNTDKLPVLSTTVSCAGVTSTFF